VSDCPGYTMTGRCRVGSHSLCGHRAGGPSAGGIRVPECYVTMPNGQPGRTDDGAWVLRWPNGRDVAVVTPSHIWRCSCECHLAAQLDLFGVA
jgi:hypothetical protein